MVWQPENLCRIENPAKLVCKEEWSCKAEDLPLIPFTPSPASQIPPNQNIVANTQEVQSFLKELVEKYQARQNPADFFRLLDQGEHAIEATLPLRKGVYNNQLKVTASDTTVAIHLKIENGIIVGKVQFHPSITLMNGYNLFGPFSIDVQLLELEFREDRYVFARGKAFGKEQMKDATEQITQLLLGESATLITKPFSEIVKTLLNKPAETGCIKRAEVVSKTTFGCTGKNQPPLCSSEMPDFQHLQANVQSTLIKQLERFFGFQFLPVHYHKESISIRGRDSFYPFQTSFQWDHLFFDNRLVLSNLHLNHLSMNPVDGGYELVLPEAKIGTVFFTPGGFPAAPPLSTVIHDVSVTGLKLNLGRDSIRGTTLQSADGVIHWGSFSMAESLKLQPGKIPFHFETTPHGFIAELSPVEFQIDEMKFQKGEIFGATIARGVIRIKKENGRMSYEANGVPLALVATIAGFKTDGLFENLHCADANLLGNIFSSSHSLELNRCQLSGLFRYSFSSKLQGNIDLQNGVIEKIKIESIPQGTIITLDRTDFDLLLHNASRLRKLIADLHLNGTVALKAEGSSRAWIIDINHLAADLNGKIRFPNGLVSGESYIAGSPVRFLHDRFSDILTATPSFILEARGELSSPICKKVDFDNILIGLNEFFINGRKTSAWLNGLIQLSGKTSFNSCAGTNGEIVSLTANGTEDQISQFNCRKEGKLEIFPDLQIGKAACTVRGVR